MSWTECLGNPLPITSTYSSSPSLEKVRLFELVLHQDGPRVSLRFDLNSLPDHPAAKWRGSEYNRVQLTLALIDVVEIRAQGWTSNNIGDIAINRFNDQIRLTFRGEGTRIECVARFAEIARLSGYLTSEPVQ